MNKDETNTDSTFKTAAHIYGLDGLRTLAITGVTLFHLMPQTFVGGYLGVSLFFVLTGYLSAYTCERNFTHYRFSLAEYYWKRIKRLYPLLLLVILVTIGTYSFWFYNKCWGLVDTPVHKAP
ncbi:acyltransferase, partial [uncultured Megasphaera sp.]|uniref:acyltransferase family protein n=1 Tax=uncultured Megasphaera sp. TaxID=165188 RepID=UPI00260854E9